MSARTNIMSDEFRANPYPYYAEMRRSQPVVQVEPGGMWAISRYRDVERVMKSPELFAQGFRAAWEPPWLPNNPLARSVLALDGKEHGRLRAIVSGAFGPRAVSRLEPRVRALAGELAEAIEARGEVDIITALAMPLPAFMIADLLGVDPALQPNLKRWTDDLVSITPVPEGPEQVARVKGTIDELTGILGSIVAARRSAPASDFASDLIRAEASGQRLRDDEILAFMLLLLLGGFDTTTYLIANALILLADRPDVAGALRADPRRVPRFIEEVLRHDPPVHGLPRLAAEDIEVAGVVIPKGALVLALIGSANRDEARFKAPDTFDLGRDEVALSFGHGIHYCLGAALARLEAIIAIEVLVSRFRSIERAGGELEYNRSLTVRGVVSLPLRFTPG
jgi:cytochrome P450